MHSIQALKLMVRVQQESVKSPKRTFDLFSNHERCKMFHKVYEAKLSKFNFGFQNLTYFIAYLMAKLNLGKIEIIFF